MKKYQRNILLGFISLTGLVLLVVFIYPTYNSTLEINTYIQTYSTAFLSFLTFLYVLVTFLILTSTLKMNNEQFRPYVVVTFPISYLNINFVIKNIGKRPAHNVKIKIEPPIDVIQQDILKGNCTPMLFQNFIAPEQEFKNYITSTFALLSSKNENLPKCFNVEVSYSDSLGNAYFENHKINFDTFTYKKKIINKDINDYLKGIEKHLEDISKSISKE